MTLPLFLSLPLEIVEHILDCVDDPSDVLALGLSCHALLSLTVPDHLHYRRIRVPNIRVDNLLRLWNDLCEVPRRANNVRVLHVGPSFQSFHVPPLASNLEANSAGEMAFVNALALMSGLQELALSTNVIEFWLLEQVWTALNAATDIRSLRIISHEGLVIPGSSDEVDMASSKLFDLRFPLLARLSLTLYMSEREENSIPRLTPFLLACKALTELEIRVYRRGADLDLSSLFASARWPLFKRLELVAVSVNADAARDFLVSHPSLERLGYRAFGFRLGNIPAGAFPNLRSFGGHSTRDLPILVAIGAPRLEEITHIYSEGSIQAFQEPLFAFKKTLRRLSFYFIPDHEDHAWLATHFPEIRLIDRTS